MSNLVIIDDANYLEHVDAVLSDGHERARGLVARDYAANPIGSYGAARPFPAELLIPRSEWRDRLEQQKRDRARLIDVRNRGKDGEPIPALDQDGKGYCWAHSSVSACLLARAAQGEPWVDLSAFAVACIIKGYRDQGGWGSQSLDFIATRGVPTSEFWPQQSMSRANDNPRTWENAKLHRFTEWYDLESRNLDQFVSACLLGWPIVSDFNWWGHSVCTMCLETVGDKVADLSTWILNSWSNGWSQHGAGILKGSKALPDDALACCVTTPSSK
ncbi:MAG: hypothetical protein AB7G28_26345 [Pirellulales bacterium]